MTERCAARARSRFYALTRPAQAGGGFKRPSPSAASQLHRRPKARPSLPPLSPGVEAGSGRTRVPAPPERRRARSSPGKLAGVRRCRRASLRLCKDCKSASHPTACVSDRRACTCERAVAFASSAFPCFRDVSGMFLGGQPETRKLSPLTPPRTNVSVFPPPGHETPALGERRAARGFTAKVENANTGERYSRGRLRSRA